MNITLIKKSWLLRQWKVSDGVHSFTITYNGRGTGYESVLVDDDFVQRVRSIFWYIPRFEFDAHGAPFAVDVRVWPWFAIRSIRLSSSGQSLYTEGYFRK